MGLYLSGVNFVTILIYVELEIHLIQTGVATVKRRERLELHAIKRKTKKKEIVNFLSKPHLL